MKPYKEGFRMWFWAHFVAFFHTYSPDLPKMYWWEVIGLSRGPTSWTFSRYSEPKGWMESSSNKYICTTFQVWEQTQLSNLFVKADRIPLRTFSFGKVFFSILFNIAFSIDKAQYYDKYFIFTARGSPVITSQERVEKVLDPNKSFVDINIGTNLTTTTGKNLRVVCPSLGFDAFTYF